MNIPVSIITDLDIDPEEEDISENGSIKKDIQIESKKQKYDGQTVKTFVSPIKTLEYCIASSKILRKIFYKAVLSAFREQKEYQEQDKNKIINDSIEKIDELFTSWTENNIESKIYNQILGKEKILDLCKVRIPKSLLAQYFAKILSEDNSISKESILNDENIKYLIDAIQYASGKTN